MWLSVNIYCAYAALSWRNKRMLMNVIYKIQMYSLHVEKDTVFTSVQWLSYVLLFVIPWTAAHQASLSITNSQSLLKLISIESVVLSNISSSVVSFSSCLQSFPALRSFPMSQFFASGGQSIGVSVSASVLPMNNQDWFPLGRTGWIPCSPRNFQESSPAPQFKISNSLVLSFLYSPILTSIHDYWKSHCFD